MYLFKMFKFAYYKPKTLKNLSKLLIFLFMKKFRKIKYFFIPQAFLYDKN